jgi:putative inorganic carbon (HCO3(-)) transporter
MLCFIGGNMYMYLFKRFYFYPYNSIPLILGVIYFAIFHLQKLVFLLAFCTPLAISLKEMGLTQGPDLSIPTEPLMAGIMLLYILNNLNQKVTDIKFMRHPVSIIIFCQLVWMFITVLTSTEIIISAKFFVSRLWFMFSCYYIIQHLFHDRRNIKTFIYSYSAALAIVVCYTTVVHAKFNFNEKAADWVVSPFYNDHTAYAAALAMFIPVLFSYLFLKSVTGWGKAFSLGLFLLFVVGIILSFTRAGWISLAVVIAILLTMWLRIKFSTIIITLVTLVTLFLVFQTEIVIALNRINTDSEGGFAETIESIFNISTDASNLERLNRWSCAIRMWEDKPVFGFGPGTYMFKYAPYQLSRQLTIISTNFGTNGNAHSEYLGPLAEQGVFGMLIVLVLLFYTSHLGYRLYYSLAEREDRIMCLGMFLGLMTFFVHGFLNNFLDTDKLSLPFWAYMAALVCFDIYCPKKSLDSNSRTGFRDA